jgi:predicted transposase/invertase (TIGR01784 family)
MKDTYDRGYKALFSHVELLKELLESFVSEPWVQEADFTTAELVNTSFISPHYRKTESDLIWKLPLKQGTVLYIYILLEFQSTVDYLMSFRLLRYIVDFYSSLLKTTPDLKRFPPVFPLVLYNGEGMWTAPLSFSELVEQAGSSTYIPAFTYYKVAVNELPRDDLMHIKNIVSTLFLMETLNLEDLASTIGTLVSILEKEQPELIKEISRWLYQILGNRAPELMTEVTAQLTEVPGMLEANIERWKEDIYQQGLQQGVKRGVKKGVQQGARQALMETARKLKARGVATEEIMDITGLNRAEIEAL